MTEIPYGYCHCGCGGLTKIANWTTGKTGAVKGQPNKYRSGHRPLVPLAERFRKLVNMTDGCWEWLSTKNRQGYGRMCVTRHKKVFAHRLSWQIHTGKDPGDLCVLHKCDNPGCVNPDHLFLGTKYDNAHDMVSKGRHARCRGSAKLTEKDVLEIRAVKPFYTYNELAPMYGVSSQTVKAVCIRKYWRSI